MSSASDSLPVKSYYIQHVQTGGEFRSADLDEVTHWMTSQNVTYLARVLEQSRNSLEGAEENAQGAIRMLVSSIC